MHRQPSHSYEAGSVVRWLRLWLSVQEVTHTASPVFSAPRNNLNLLFLHVYINISVSPQKIIRRQNERQENADNNLLPELNCCQNCSKEKQQRLQLKTRHIVLYNVYA